MGANRIWAIQQVGHATPLARIEYAKRSSLPVSVSRERDGGNPAVAAAAAACCLLLADAAVACLRLLLLVLMLLLLLLRTVFGLINFWDPGARCDILVASIVYITP